jgi:protein SCO1/2
MNEAFSWRWALRFVLVVLLIGAWVQMKPALVSEPIRDYGPTPEFSLTDQTGRMVRSDELRGSLLVVGFIFTRCPSVCPSLSARMQRLQYTLAPLPENDVKLLSISIDPEHDTPEVLAAYAAEYDADASRWHFLTSDQTTIQAVLKGFHVSAERIDDPDKPDNILHSEAMLLVDADGTLIGVYQGEEEQLVKLPQTIRRILYSRA